MSAPAGLGPRLLGDTAGGRAVPQSTKASFMWRSLGPGDSFWVCVSGNENVRWQLDSSERKSSAQLVDALDIYGTFWLSRSLSPERRASKHFQRSRSALIAEQQR